MTYIVLSGVPASGKSRLAARLAPALTLPVIDKDTILETLFDQRGVGDDAWRSHLSRQADEIFYDAASTAGSALLVSWWRHPLLARETGTPVDGLAALPGRVIELHCVCEPRVAVERFLQRRRHSGHRDTMRTREELLIQFAELAPLGPLACGPSMTVATDADVPLADVLAFIHRFKGLEQIPK